MPVLRDRFVEVLDDQPLECGHCGEWSVCLVEDSGLFECEACGESTDVETMIAEGRLQEMMR